LTQVCGNEVMHIPRIVSEILSQSGLNSQSSPNSQSGPAARSGAIDAVRLLGIVAVVAGHTLMSPLIRPLLYSWHVPLFFFLSGYLWSHRRTLKVEFSKKFRSLGLPYLTWIVLIAVPFIVLDATLEPFSATRLLGPVYNGTMSAMPFTTFWFVSTLFATVVLLRLLWRLPRPVVWGIAVGGMIVAYYAGNLLAQTPLSIGSALPCLFFVLCGTLASRLRASITRPLLVGCLLLGGAVTLIAMGYSAPLDIKAGNYGTPVVSAFVAVAISFALVLVAEALFSHFPVRVGQVATRLATAGFVIVLIHPLVLWVLLKFGGPVPNWAIFVAALGGSCVVGQLVTRTRASAWLTGTERPKVQPRELVQSRS
jgi:acyltransferase